MSNINTVAVAAAVSGDIGETRSVIASLISKPKMTDKLLARPPFRFLFDIIIAVNAATDLELEQVLTEAELDSANLKDKSSKLLFLDKVIKHVETRLDITIDLSAKKVVAGLETEKTRRFLQLLATAATTNAPTVTSGKSGPPPGKVTKDGKVEAPTDTTDVSTADISPRGPSPLEDVIVETRSAITSIINKPKITDKLLARPPFRFLFDIIIAVDAATDLGLEQVLTVDEYDSSNVTDKASKLLLLDKIVKHVEGKLDTTIDINPKKVVAGLEPDKTCAFLQLLAAAAMLPPDHKGSDEEVSGSKDKEDEIRIDADDADDATLKVDEIPDTLNLTSESQFLAIAKDGSAGDPESLGEAGVDGSSSITADNGDAEDPAPVEPATKDIEVEESKEDVDVEITDNGQETGDVVSEDDETLNGRDGMLVVDGPRSDKESVNSSNSPVVDKDIVETTGHPLERAGTSAGIEELLPNALISSMSDSVDAVDCFTKETAGANSEPTMDLQATIEAVLSVTTPLGECLGDMDVAAMNEERAYWNDQVGVETRKLEEYRRQQDAAVLAPLLQKIETLDAEIVEKEKEIEETLERIGDADESD